MLSGSGVCGRNCGERDTRCVQVRLSPCESKSVHIRIDSPAAPTRPCFFVNGKSLRTISISIPLSLSTAYKIDTGDSVAVLFQS